MSRPAPRSGLAAFAANLSCCYPKTRVHFPEYTPTVPTDRWSAKFSRRLARTQRSRIIRRSAEKSWKL